MNEYHKNNNENKDKIYIADMKVCDVNGDYIPDIVWIYGKKIYEDSPLLVDLTLRIRCGKTCIVNDYPLAFDAGINPKLFLGDFTGDKICDILVSIPTGGSGGYIYNYLFSYVNNVLTPLFDAEMFNQGIPLEAEFDDCYKVRIYNDDLGINLSLDISSISNIDELYDKNGKLISPTSGEVLALGGLYPLDMDFDNIFELASIQRVIGRYNAETLGYVRAIWKFYDNMLNLERIEVVSY